MTRPEAKLAGANRYTGKPCSEGHTERYTRNRRCVLCQQKSNRERIQREKKPEPTGQDIFNAAWLVN